LELEDGSISSSLDSLIGGAGAVLPGLLLVGDPGGDGPEQAFRLARAWVRTGRRVILVDLQFESPSLHDLAGVENDQGIADHFVFGTSLDLLAAPVDGGTWSLVPAGPWVADPATILGSPGWPRLLRECADRDATLLAYRHADTPGLAALSNVFGAVVVLGAVRELPGVRPYSVVAVLQTSGEPATALATKAGLAETPDEAFERIRLPTDSRTREQLIADLRYRQRAALMSRPGDSYRPSLADLDVTEPPAGAAEAAVVLSPEAVLAAATQGPADASVPGVPERKPVPISVLLGEPPPARRVLLPPRRSRAPLWWTVAVIGLLSLLAGSWHLVQARRRARLASEDAVRALEVPIRVPQPLPALPPPAADTVLAYVVALEEHVRLPSALERVSALRSGLPDVQHFVVPVVRDDALYYRVASGPLADSVAAAALRDTMVARREQRAASEAEVQRAPLVFLLGEYPTQDSADARVNGLRRLEIPSYVVPMAGPPESFRVYVGGYAVPAEARVMREILQSVGEPDVLVERVGRR